MLWHLPSDVIDRSNKTLINLAPVGEISTLKVVVREHIPSHSPKSPYRVICEDASGSITLTFFKVYKDYIAKNLPIGEERVISGKVEFFGNSRQMSHPDYIVSLDKLALLPLKEAVYPLCAGLSSKIIHKYVKEALNKVPELLEWLDDSLLKREGWDSFNNSLIKTHDPNNAEDINPQASSRRRLAYDELLASQLALALSRAGQKKLGGLAICGDKSLRNKVFKSLPFALTDSQISALKEIGKDMAAPERMLRLLQGDVGSGKTIVAFFALLNAVEAGYQGAFMVPTDILARQHFTKLKDLAEIAGINLALLTGKDSPKEKSATTEAIANGSIDIVIGTHALFQTSVTFKKLGLVVIDEQHRFGVHQRLALAEKGEAPDVLVMTATPIPRSLALTMYGDMDISYLKDKPSGRKPIHTAAIPNTKFEEVLTAVARALKAGDKLYWICPLVEESEVLDLAAAEERYQNLSSIFGDQVGLVHGKMKLKDKDIVMQDFANPQGKIKLLVATTVVEVGVDVPEANIMIIEHASRFGLAQLHQLRGRVGRGTTSSSCLLLYDTPLSATALARLNTIRDSEDGFHIAEEDLKIRGFGEVLGSRQSGLPNFKLASFPEHNDLLKIAASDARFILNKDKNLTSSRGLALRNLLYLFDMDNGIKNLGAG